MAICNCSQAMFYARLRHCNDTVACGSIVPFILDVKPDCADTMIMLHEGFLFGSAQGNSVPIFRGSPPLL